MPQAAVRTTISSGFCKQGRGADTTSKRSGPAIRCLELARAVHAIDRRLRLVGLAGSKLIEAAAEIGLVSAGEAFADRRYEPDGTLRSRQFPDALITDPQAAAAQALRLARQGNAETICVHGDTPGAVEILKACHEALE